MKAPNIVTFAIVILTACCAVPAAQAVTVPANFVVENAIPAATFSTPTVLAFLPDGRWLVGEKRGRVYVVTNGVLNPTPMLNISREVLNAVDRGMLGLAVDPNFATNRYIYVLYTVDPDSNDVESNDDAFGRLTRYQVSASNPNLVDPASRTVLIGATWRTGIPSGSPSHTIGTLMFGADGSLLVSCGDGGQFNMMDDGGNDDGLFGATRTDPAEDIGAFRAQYLSSLAGKILRVDPATGGGYPSNPFWDGNPSSNRSRVWAYGLRNPFRFTVRPGTGNPDPAAGNPGVLYIGDVGWSTFEEQNVATQGGRNFGWPCYEGVGLSSDYPNAHPAHHGCSSIGTPDNPSTPTPPHVSTHHSNGNVSSPVGLTGNTAVGGAWYMGTLYPSTYRQRYFFADYSQNWIKVATMTGTDQLVSVANFATAADGPVCLQTDPQTGDLLYVAIATNAVRRIRYTGATGNGNPVADARATPDIGVAPLSVQFTGSGSFDPDGDPLAWSWNFGDASGATVANPTHVYNIAGAYDVVLTVTDGRGGVGRDTVRVTVATNNDFPTTTVVDNFNRANGPIGGSWVGLVSGLNIANNAITPTTGYVSPVWNGATFGADQEAYVTLATPGSVPEQDLMLKIQGTSWDNGHIEVRYDAIAGVVKVNTYAPGVGWVMHTSLPATYSAGDVLGARAWSNGAVEIYRNGIRLGSTSVAGWAFAGNGGRIGLTIAGPSGARLDNFGGGNVVLNSNTRPDGTILSPAPGSFFFAGQTLTLDASATDSQDPPASLTYRWEVDVHHNNHTHPNSHTFDTRTASLVGENHDDGTGVFYRVRLIVTDTGGLKDTSAVDIFPEIDLTPSAVVTTPASPTAGAPADYVFKLYNRGRMPAPLSRWMLRAGGTLMAQGDTIVAANDSIVVTRRLGPLAAGSYTLRVVADTLAAVVENNEANNAATRTLTVIGAPDLTPPSFVTGPAVSPSVTSALVQWTTNEPARGAVRFGLGASPTDSGLTTLGTTHAATLAGLARATSYTYRVAISDGAGNTTVSAPATFATLANRPPAIGSASATPLSGGAPLSVQFTAGATDPDGDTPTYGWAFGDGQNGNGPSVSHVYAAGTYTATLTVSDGFGGSATATFTITATPGGFPTTGVLDDFNRPNGAIGGSWVDETTNLVITGNRLGMNASGWRSPVWNGAIYGPDQEAYVRLNAITATSPEHDLMLKVQSTSHSSGHIEVRYDAQAKRIAVNTHAPSQGWVARGSITNLTLAAGDVLGARAFGNGSVEVFRNGVKLGTYSVTGWPFAASGGRIGLTLANATGSLLDDFGGGNVVTNTKPAASIVAPANNAFYFPGQGITLTGSATDAQDAPAALAYRWEVELNAGGAVVSTTVFTTASASFTAQSAAGADPFYLVRLIVTDSGGLKDTVTVRLNPEIDLEPPAFVSLVANPGVSSARIQWTTSEPVRGVLRWGATEALGDSVATPLGTTHDLTVGGLAAETSYHGQVAITDGAGNTTLSELFIFQAQANRPPVSTLAPTPASGMAPLSVSFSSAGSGDPDGDPLTYAWSFGNGQTSALANPTTVYSAPGTFTVTLTVRDPSLASATATTTVTVSALPSFPVTAMLDNFNRANGAIGGSWVDETSNLTIASNQMRPTTSSARSTVWNGATFGPNQEAYVTLAAITSNSPEHDLMLKVQGTSWSAGHIEVRYDHVVKRVTVQTYAPTQGWVARGSLTITLVAGDRFGARALASGNLEVYRNGSKLATYSIAGWPFNAQGGRLGLTLDKAGSSRLDDFGGGTLPTGLTLAAAGGCVDAPPEPDSPPDTLSAARAADLDTQSARATDFETQRDAPWTAPASVTVSAAYPNPSGGGVSLALELPRIARVTWTILDLQGRVMARGERATNSGRPVIHWSGTNDAGDRAGAGLYLARVTVDRETFTRRIVLLK